MKQIYFLSIIFFPLLSVSQIPPKKATKVIVHSIDSTNELLGKITVTLFDRGFTVEHKDEKLKLISTNERPAKKGSYTTKIRASIKDSIIIFTSVLSLDFEPSILRSRMTKSFSPVYYGGMKNSAIRNAWDEMVEIAKLFGPITFEK